MTRTSSSPPASGFDALDAVVLKGAAAVRAGWADRVRRFVDVDSPGLTTSRVIDLPHERAPRPLWPLDQFDWAPWIRAAGPSAGTS